MREALLLPGLDWVLLLLGLSDWCPSQALIAVGRSQAGLGVGVTPKQYLQHLHSLGVKECSCVVGGEERSCMQEMVAFQ